MKKLVRSAGAISVLVLIIFLSSGITFVTFNENQSNKKYTISQALEKDFIDASVKISDLKPGNVSLTISKKRFFSPTSTITIPQGTVLKSTNKKYQDVMTITKQEIYLDNPIPKPISFSAVCLNFKKNFGKDTKYLIEDYPEEEKLRKMLFEIKKDHYSFWGIQIATWSITQKIPPQEAGIYLPLPYKGDKYIQDGKQLMRNIGIW